MGTSKLLQIHTKAHKPCKSCFWLSGPHTNFPSLDSEDLREDSKSYIFYMNSEEHRYMIEVNYMNLSTTNLRDQNPEGSQGKWLIPWGLGLCRADQPLQGPKWRRMQLRFDLSPLKLILLKLLTTGWYMRGEHCKGLAINIAPSIWTTLNEGPKCLSRLLVSIKMCSTIE